MGVFESEGLCLFVHVMGKDLLRARQAFSDGQSPIVGGYGGHAFDQIDEWDLVLDLQKHLRAPHFPGLFADHLLLVIGHISTLESIENQVEGHHFGQTRRRYSFFRVLAVQNLTRHAVHQDGRFGVKGKNGVGLAHTRRRHRHGQKNEKGSSNTYTSQMLHELPLSTKPDCPFSSILYPLSFILFPVSGLPSSVFLLANRQLTPDPCLFPLSFCLVPSSTPPPPERVHGVEPPFRLWSGLEHRESPRSHPALSCPGPHPRVTRRCSSPSV